MRERKDTSKGGSGSPFRRPRSGEYTKASPKSKGQVKNAESSVGSSQGYASSANSSRNVSSNQRSLEHPTNLGDVVTLRDLSIILETSELIAVVGSVGSGKSSFLLAILSEMEPLNDSSRVNFP